MSCSVTSSQLIFRVDAGGFLIGNYTVLFEISVFLFVCFFHDGKDHILQYTCVHTDLFLLRNKKT